MFFQLFFNFFIDYILWCPCFCEIILYSIRKLIKLNFLDSQRSIKHFLSLFLIQILYNCLRFKTEAFIAPSFFICINWLILSLICNLVANLFFQILVVHYFIHLILSTIQIYWAQSKSKVIIILNYCRRLKNFLFLF